MTKPVQHRPDVLLEDIVTYVSREYKVNEEDLRGPSRKRTISEARSVIGWLSRQLKARSIKDTAAYFQREPSTFSRHVGKIDAQEKISGKLRNRLDNYIKAITQA